MWSSCRAGAVGWRDGQGSDQWPTAAPLIRSQCVVGTVKRACAVQFAVLFSWCFDACVLGSETEDPDADGLGARGLVLALGAAVGSGDRVAAELVAQRGDHLHLRGVLLPGGEARVERGGDRGQRDGVVDGGVHGPAALTGVLGVA